MDLAVGGYGHLAAPLAPPEERPFGPHGTTRGRVVKKANGLPNLPVIKPAFDAERSLADGRQGELDWQVFGDTAIQADTITYDSSKDLIYANGQEGRLVQIVQRLSDIRQQLPRERVAFIRPVEDDRAGGEVFLDKDGHGR